MDPKKPSGDDPATADVSNRETTLVNDIEVGKGLLHDIQTGADPASKTEKTLRDIQIGADPASKMEKALRDIQIGADPASQAKRLLHNIPSGAGLATTWIGAVPVALGETEIKMGAGPIDGAGGRASASNPSEFSIPGYEIGREIGSGGFGRVFEARERSDLATLRAVKFIDPSPFHDRPNAIARFKREAQAVRDLDHRAIVRYVASGITESLPACPYLVMEFIAGEPFRADLGLPDVDAVEKMAEVLDALGYAHAMGIIHRDIKPTNILIRTRDGQPVIVDFGLSLFPEADAVALTTRYAGSVGYIPTEVQSGEQKSSVNHDIFSCAVSLYEILAGRRPDIQSPQPLSSFRPELAAIDPIIRQGLAPAAQRFKSAGVFASALRQGARQLEATKQLTASNSAAESFRLKAIAKREAERKSRAEKDAATVNARDAWLTWSRLINAAARRAFEDMLIVAKEVHERYFLDESLQAEDQESPEVLPIFALRKGGRAVDVVFAMSALFCDDPLGRGHDEPGSPGAPPARPELLGPGIEAVGRSWLVFSEEANYETSRVLFGALTVAMLPGETHYGLYAFPLREAVSPGSRELRTADEIRTYVTNAVGQALGL